MTSNPTSALERAKRLARRVRYRSSEKPDAVVNPYDELTARLNRQHGRIAAIEREIARIAPQIAAIEVRLEDLRQRLEEPVSDETERAEAVSLVEEIRREHQRVRARVSAAARYEERLRQLEEAVSQLEGQRTDQRG